MLNQILRYKCRWSVNTSTLMETHVLKPYRQKYTLQRNHNSGVWNFNENLTLMSQSELLSIFYGVKNKMFGRVLVAFKLVTNLLVLISINQF